MDASSKIKLDRYQLEELVAGALREHPDLAHVERVEIVRLYGGLPNWDVASITPTLRREHYPAAFEIVNGLRLTYHLREEG